MAISTIIALNSLIAKLETWLEKKESTAGSGKRVGFQRYKRVQGQELQTNPPTNAPSWAILTSKNDLNGKVIIFMPIYIKEFIQNLYILMYRLRKRTPIQVILVQIVYGSINDNSFLWWGCNVTPVHMPSPNLQGSVGHYHVHLSTPVTSAVVGIIIMFYT